MCHREVLSEDVVLYCGDFLGVMPGIGDQSVGAVITDPPYGVGIEYTDMFDDTPEYVRELVPRLIEDGERVAKVVLFPSGKYENELWVMQNYPPRWRICWYKGSQSTNSPIGFSDWEMIFVYGSDIHRYVHDYMSVKPARADNGHPCPKEVRWATWLIEKFTKPGDIVLDPFMGSGTTGVAAVRLGRKFIGIELVDKYFDIAVSRIRQEMRQTRMF